MTKKALVALDKRTQQPSGQFLLPSQFDQFSLVSERTGEVVETAVVVYTGRAVTLEALVQRLDRCTSTADLSPQETEQLAEGFLTEIARFKVGTWVQVDDCAHKFCLQDVDRRGERAAPLLP